MLRGYLAPLLPALNYHHPVEQPTRLAMATPTTQNDTSAPNSPILGRRRTASLNGEYRHISAGRAWDLSLFVSQRLSSEALRKLPLPTRRSTRGTFQHQSTLETMHEHHPSIDDPRSSGLENAHFIDVVHKLLGKDSESAVYFTPRRTLRAMIIYLQLNRKATMKGKCALLEGVPHSIRRPGGLSRFLRMRSKDMMHGEDSIGWSALTRRYAGYSDQKVQSASSRFEDNVSDVVCLHHSPPQFTHALFSYKNLANSLWSWEPLQVSSRQLTKSVIVYERSPSCSLSTRGSSFLTATSLQHSITKKCEILSVGPHSQHRELFAAALETTTPRHALHRSRASTTLLICCRPWTRSSSLSLETSHHSPSPSNILPSSRTVLEITPFSISNPISTWVSTL